MKVLPNHMSWVEAKEYFSRNKIVILPIGSNEQHGPPKSLWDRSSYSHGDS
ncbi:creatininase family protein [Candidatus Bathyarchaeota archaeon]|nr:creatininase family protein [Candidatus Bathyarchaeota archaeon]